MGALAWIVVLGLFADASASASIKKAIWGPVEVGAVSQFPIYSDLGVGIYEYQLTWNSIAPSRPSAPRDPSDPAYRWPPALDLALANARIHGIRVAVMLTAAPGWATGGRGWEWAPKEPRDF